MFTFYEWLEKASLDEIARFYYNQQTFDKWYPLVIDQAIDRAFAMAQRSPGSWRSFNLPHWQRNRKKLKQQMAPIAQEIFDYNTGMSQPELMSLLATEIAKVFQKGPYTRRHIQYANSLGKHPDEVEPRKVGGGRRAIPVDMMFQKMRDDPDIIQFIKQQHQLKYGT